MSVVGKSTCSRTLVKGTGDESSHGGSRETRVAEGVREARDAGFEMGLAL